MAEPLERCPSFLLSVLLHLDWELQALDPSDSYRLFELLHGAVARLMPTDAFYVCLYAEDDGTLFFPYNFDGQRYDEPIIVPLGEGPTSWVVRHNLPFVLDQDNRAVQDGNIGFGDTERVSQSAIHTPIRGWGETGERMLGVLSAQSYRLGAYGEEAVAALQLLASRAGEVLSRAAEAAAWRARLSAAEARAAERHRQEVALSERFVHLLAGLTLEAEGLRDLVPRGRSKLREAVESLCRSCYRAQTLANQLPLRSPGRPPGPDPVDLLAGLTDRERDILRLLASGESMAGVAAHLHITQYTVKYHCKSLYRKLGARDRYEAVQKLSAAPLPDEETAGKG